MMFFEKDPFCAQFTARLMMILEYNHYLIDQTQQKYVATKVNRLLK